MTIGWGKTPWLITEQSGKKKARMFIHHLETRAVLGTRQSAGPLSSSLGPFLAAHVRAELEKEEEEGQYQSTHQDVMEELRLGI